MAESCDCVETHGQLIRCAACRDAPQWVSELSTGPKGWLINSLRHRLREAETAERKARKAYTLGGMKVACRALADAHAKAAEAYRQALHDVYETERGSDVERGAE